MQLQTLPRDLRILLVSILQRFIGRPETRRDHSQVSHPKNSFSLVSRLFVEFPNYKQIFEKNEKNSIILIIGIVTANLRACQSMSTKMDAIALLKKLSDMCDPALVSDRVIPYLVALLHDCYAQVRGEAVFAITEVLEGFSFVPEEETRLLVDYIFPRLVSSNAFVQA